eukprot:9432185-Lingulodinium_polyedra.AAC.1
MARARRALEPLQLGNTPDGPSFVVQLARQWAIAARAGPLDGVEADGPTVFLKTDLRNAYGRAYRH